MRPFGARLAAAIAERGRVCVGIDPHPGLLAAWGLGDDAAGVREFGLRTVDALGGRVAALKPQVAFFERHGAAGMAALEDVLAAGKAVGTLMIVDAKRGDIGSTMQGYADAFCREGSPLAGDAVTLSPFLGIGSLTPAIDTALENGRGVFVLCLTSNPEGAAVQLARGEGATSVAASIASAASELNARELADPRNRGLSMGSVGLVVGATVGDAARAGEVDLERVRGPLLVPGVGAQGGSAETVRGVVGSAWEQVLVSTSREVLQAGPGATQLREAAERTGAALR